MTIGPSSPTAEASPARPAAAQAARSVLLVAGRELRVKLATRSFVIGTVVILAVLAGYLLLQTVLFAGGASSSVGLTGHTTEIAEPLESSAAELGLTVETSTVDRDAAPELLEAGELDAVIAGTATDPQVLVDSELDQQLRAALSALDREQTLAEAGVDDPAAVLAEAGEVEVTALSPADGQQGERLIIGLVMAFLLFFGISTYGTYVAMGVVEEKSSRVVEVLLATLRPWQLLLGKVLGIGAVGLIQLVVIATGGVLVATAADVLTVTGVAASALAWGVVWYVLGFLLYATLYASAGSLVSRQEDAQSVLTPVTMLVVIGFVVGFNVLVADPTGTAVATLSLVPPLAPLLIPGRVAAGEIAGWEIAVAAGLTVATIALLIWAGGAIYRNAVLHMGGRLALRDALRPAR